MSRAQPIPCKLSRHHSEEGRSRESPRSGVCEFYAHIAFGSTRMEPVFMVPGQSSAIAASIPIDKKINLHQLGYSDLKKELLAGKQHLEVKTNDVKR